MREGESRAQDEPPMSGAANDNSPAAVTPMAANDNVAAMRAANDNEPGIRVIDDLPRPLPVMPGEGEIIRKLLGDRFRQILFGGKS